MDHDKHAGHSPDMFKQKFCFDQALRFLLGCGLLGDGQEQLVLAGAGQHFYERLGGKVLEFIDVQIIQSRKMSDFGIFLFGENSLHLRKVWLKGCDL